MNNISEMATYPQAFDLNYFKSLKSFASRVKYCNQKLYRLGSGSSRIVYIIDDETVLKLAKNNKGIAQNNLESESWLSDYYDIFANVYECDDDGLWIEMQKANKAKPSDFKRITGKTFAEFQNFVWATRNSYSRPSPFSRHTDEFDWDEYLEIEPFRGLYGYMTDTQMDAIGDFNRISSWGIVNDRNNEDRLVLIDYGLNDDVYNEFYNKPTRRY